MVHGHYQWNDKSNFSAVTNFNNYRQVLTLYQALNSNPYKTKHADMIRDLGKVCINIMSNSSSIDV